MSLYLFFNKLKKEKKENELDSIQIKKSNSKIKFNFKTSNFSILRCEKTKEISGEKNYSFSQVYEQFTYILFFPTHSI